MVVFRILQMLLLYDWHEFFLVVADPDLDGFFSNKKAIYTHPVKYKKEQKSIFISKRKRKNK